MASSICKISVGVWYQLLEDMLQLFGVQKAVVILVAIFEDALAFSVKSTSIQKTFLVFRQAR